MYTPRTKENVDLWVSLFICDGETRIHAWLIEKEFGGDHE
jgi:hypothetical protein